MKYFRPIGKGTNEGMTFKQYIKNNYITPLGIAILAVLWFVVGYFLKDEKESLYTALVFLGLTTLYIAIIVIDWGLKRKRWEV